MTDKKEISVKLKDLPLHNENPFLDGVGYNTRKRKEILYNGKQAIINTQTGEVLEDQIAIFREKEVDKDQFLKLYLGNLWLFFDLGKPAQRVAEFVLNQIGHRAIGKGEILLTYAEYEKHFEGRIGGARPTYMRGLQELAEKNLLAKSETNNVWFINPTVIFNGDRASFINTFRKKKISGVAALEAKGQKRLQLNPNERENNE